MPKKNVKGGSGYKKRKKVVQTNNAIIERENDQTYAKVIKLLGSGRLELECYYGEENVKEGIQIKKNIGIICGRMRKRVWINVGDYVLVSIRNFEKDKVDVIHKYKTTEITDLKKYIKICAGDLSDITFDNNENIFIETENHALNIINELDEDNIDEIDDI